MRTVEEAADLLAAGAGRIGTTSAASLHDRALGRREDDSNTTWRPARDSYEV